MVEIASYAPRAVITGACSGIGEARQREPAPAGAGSTVLPPRNVAPPITDAFGLGRAARNPAEPGPARPRTRS